MGRTEVAVAGKGKLLQDKTECEYALPSRDVNEDPSPQPPCEEEWDEDGDVVVRAYDPASLTPETYRKLRALFDQQDGEARRLAPRTFGRRSE